MSAAAVSDEVLVAAIAAHCRVLKVPTVARECAALARQALGEAWPPLAYLRAVLDVEVATRTEHAIARRLKAARLPARKTLAQFEWSRSHGLERPRVEDLAKGAWVTAARNLVLMGPVGTGKTHVAIALTIEAIKRGHSALFYRVSDLVRTLTEARDARSLGRLHERLRRVAVLVLDEWGFVPFDKVGGELLFDLLATRHERVATVITTNLAFGEWNRVLGDDKLTAALLDRLAQHADVLVTRGPSERLPRTGTRPAATEEVSSAPR
jgi:DNA replication protein DnaC